MKNRHLVALALLVVAIVAVPLFAAVTTTNNGDGTTTLRASYLVPTANVTTVRDDICRGINWTAQVTCTQALVTAGKCTSGQLGTQVANPQTCIQAIDGAVRQFLLDARKRGAVQAADDASVAPVRSADQSSDITP